MSTKYTRRTVLGAGLVAATAALVPGASTALAQQKKGLGRHPHIQAALRHLNGAHTQLQEAAHDYGGHRSAAAAAVKTAIAECEQALKFTGKKKV